MSQPALNIGGKVPEVPIIPAKKGGLYNLTEHQENLYNQPQSILGW